WESARDLQDLVPVGRAPPAAVAVARRDVEVAVRPHHDVAKPALALGRVAGEVNLVLLHLVAAKGDPMEGAGAARADEEAAAPLRDRPARVDRGAAGGHCLAPGESRRDKPALLLAAVDGRPAEVVPLARHVDLVVAASAQVSARPVVDDEHGPVVTP